ncbi:MAG: hypothetical protein AB1721_01380 [Patescibacteria group bacterium]
MLNSPALEKSSVLESLDFEKIKQILIAIEQNILDNLPGATQEQINWLKQEINNYKTLKKVQKAIRKNERLSQNNLSVLEKADLNPETIPYENCLVILEFLQAILAVAEYTTQAIEENWPQKNKEREKPSLEFIEKGTRANLQFIDFFLKAKRHFNLSPEQLFDFYFRIFGYSRSSDGLSQELKIVGLDSFPPGILAALRALVYLENERPDETFYTPTIQQDMYYGVDLVSEKRDEAGNTLGMSLYQIKGRNKGKEADVFDLSNDEDRKKLDQAIAELPDWDQEHHRKVLDNLLYYQKELQQKTDYPVRAYWVEVLMPKQK